MHFFKANCILKRAGEAVINCSGVGYFINISMQTYDKLPDINSDVFLNTYLIVREDAHQLFGFIDTQELELFKLLISISGVGPKVSLGILSSISAIDLCNAIVRNDLLKLQKLPGIGKKTAERIVLELKDKILKLDISATDSITQTSIVNSNMVEEAIAALMSLGFNKSSAERSVKLSENDFNNHTSQTIEVLIKLALKYAMK